jgi:hypothetical protein
MAGFEGGSMTVQRIALLGILSVVAWVPSVQAHVSGGGPATSDCFVTFEGIESSSNTVECTDGGFCDADGAQNGSCTFPVQVCVFDTEVEGCTPAPVTKLKGSKLLPSLPTVPASASACGEPNNVVVALKKGGTKRGKKKIKVSAKTDTGSPKKDTDKVKLVCNPSTGGPIPGDRTFSVVYDAANLRDPDGSHFFSSALNNMPVENFFAGSILLRAGEPDANGVASLTIAEDSYIHFRDIAEGSECMKLVAQGSEGKIDCDGGTPVGTKMVEDSHGLDPSGPNSSTFELQSATDDTPGGGPGDAYIKVHVTAVTCEGVLGIPGGCPGGLPASAEDCLESAGKVNYAVGFNFDLALTTGDATAEVPNARQGVTATITRHGVPFDCQSFTGTDGPGLLVTPFILPDVTFGGVTFDTANIMYLDDTR